MSEKQANKTLNNLLVTIFSAALLSLGASHIYVLNQLSLFEEKISNNKAAYIEINGKIDELLQLNRELTKTTIELNANLKIMQNEDR